MNPDEIKLKMYNYQHLIFVRLTWPQHSREFHTFLRRESACVNSSADEMFFVEQTAAYCTITSWKITTSKE